jgi:nicotinate-nucleotide pyrophosphorylase (carboxylating)
MENRYSTIIKQALKEDIGSGDHSSNCAIPASANGQMKLIIKDDGTLAGMNVAEAVFAEVNPEIKFERLLSDGAAVKFGEIAFHISGPIRAMLQGERIALNLMQRMSGIASYTNSLVSLIAHTNCRLLDTRKTTPNLRVMEKEAVRIGGGHNHRFGLFDMIMLKDNHVDFAGGVKAAVSKAQAYLQENNLDIPIEVETRNFREIEELLSCSGVERVMFDNFSVEDTLKAIQLVAGRLATESSGGINEKTLVAYAETGVDYISVGALTHSVNVLDMSLKFKV